MKNYNFHKAKQLIAENSENLKSASLSNEAKAGFWIECKPDTLQVVNKKQIEYCSYCGKSSCNGSCS